MALILVRTSDGKLHIDPSNGFPTEHTFGAGYFKKGADEGHLALTAKLETEEGTAVYELVDFEPPDNFKFRLVEVQDEVSLEVPDNAAELTEEGK